MSETGLSDSGVRPLDGLLRLFGIHRGEGRRALLICGYLFLIICSYLIIKAVRNALFISEFGALKLPYVMIGIALLAGVCASFYIRLAKRFAVGQILVGSLLFFVSNMVVFWWFARQGFTWLVPVFYIWAGIFGVIAPTQVWTLANELLTTRQAKRMFGFIGAGGILGGAVGGWMTDQLAPRIGAPQLLLVVAGMLLLATLFVAVLSRHDRPVGVTAEEEKPPSNLAQSLRIIANNRHLRYLGLVVFISAMGTTSVDFQFSILAERHFSDSDSLASFFGLVYGSLSLIAFFFQLLLTNRVLRWLGVGFSILLLPISLLCGTAVLLGSGALWAGVLLKGSDGAFKHALDRSCRELMYLPVPNSIKLQTKSTIDTVMDRLGDGTAGVLQLILTSWLGWQLTGSLLVNFAILAVWAYFGVRIRHEYVQQLRTAMGQRSRRFMSRTDYALGADARNVLERILQRGTEAEQLGALEWVRERSIDVDETLLANIARGDGSDSLRQSALETLLRPRDGSLPQGLLSELDDEGLRLITASIELVVTPEAEATSEQLKALLGSAPERSRLPVVAFLLGRLGQRFEPFAYQLFDRMLSEASPQDARVAAVKSLVFMPEESRVHFRLGPFLSDRCAEVRAAATEVAGALRRVELLPQIIALLIDPACRRYARQAIIAMGGMADLPLREALLNRSQPLALRRQIPSMLYRVRSRSAVLALIEVASDGDLVLRDRAMDALAKLRARYPQLKVESRRFMKGRIDLWMAQEGARQRQLNAVTQARTEQDLPSLSWLEQALSEASVTSHRRLFRQLSLYYPPAEMHRVFLALRDADPKRRANALELLDNLLPSSSKRYLIPLLEGSNTRSSGDIAKALREIVQQGHPPLVAFALRVAADLRIPGMDRWANEHKNSESRSLRDESLRYLECLSGSAA